VLFEDKIYLFGGAIKTGGFFGNTETQNDLSMLDLENMKWKRIHQEKFLPLESVNNLRVEVTDNKFFIRSFFSTRGICL